MNGSDSAVLPGLAAAVACGVAIGAANYLLIWLLRIPPDHRHPVFQLHHPVHRHRLWARTADQAANRFRGFHQSSGGGRAGPGGHCHAAHGRHRGPVAANHLWPLGAGDRPECRAARLAGIGVGRIRAITYILCGALGGLNGALLAGYFRGANVDIGNEYLLASIAVVVIGGTSVAGGKANLPGIWGASLFMVLLLTMLNTFGAGAGMRLLLTGVIIVAVIALAGGKKPAR